jgi:hypothetical protein
LSKEYVKSGWIIRYIDGYKVAIDEAKYEQWNLDKNKNDVLCEEHWFDIKEGMKMNGLKNMMCK